MDDSILSNSDVSLVVEMLQQATQEEISESMQIDWQNLQMHAQRFVKAYDELEKNEALQKKAFLKNLINNPENSIYIKKMRGGDAAYFMRAKYLLAFDFDEKMTKFLGELPKEALYVYEGQGSLQTFKMPLKELAKYVNKEGRLNLSLSQLTAESRKSIEDSKEGEISIDHIAKVQAAYAGANNRLNRYYEKVGLSGSKAQGGLLMWKAGRDWQLARVTNRGDLKEAYASALMSEHKSNLDYLANIAMGGPAYYEHALIGTFFTGYIHNVTNKPAIVEEDIITDKMQYSVKSARASMPTIRQYVQTARWIAQQTSILTAEELKGYVQSNFSQDTHRNAIIATTKNLGDQVLNSLLSEQEYNAIINLKI